MLFIFLIYILFLIEISFGNQCPSFKYCTCSSDLTIIKCTNHQLTNKLLLKLNKQLPKSTILLNLSSNSLTSIKSLSNINSLQILDLSYNKIQYLPLNLFSKFPQLTTLYIQNNSLKKISKNFKNHFFCQYNKNYNEISFCQIKNFLQIYPNISQILYENEQFILNCSSNFQHYWTLNQIFYPSTITSYSYSTIIIHHLQINHSGIWTCHNRNFNRSISLTVLKNHFCPSIQMNTSKGYFYWPRTLINKKIEQICPFNSAAWIRNSNKYARAWYKCSSKGEWIHFDVSHCGFQSNISRIFDYLSLNQTNLLLNLIKYLSKINRNSMILDDIILLINLIDEQQNKYKNQDNIMLIYHLTDFILQIKHNFIYLNQYQIAIKRLRLIIERLLDLTSPSWLYIGKELTAMTIQSPLTSTLCFVLNRSLLSITCEIDNQYQQSQLATIQFPSYLNQTNQYSLFRIIVYRQSKLFISNLTKNNNNNNHPVIYIRPVSRNNLSTIKLTFYGQINESSIGIWYSNETSWKIKSSICKINKQNINLISTDCFLFNNNSLLITYINNNSKNFFLYTKYSQLIIYISSIISSICLFISIIFYIYFYKINKISKYFFHCLINYWFNLDILLLLFAFGIKLNQYSFLCQFIAISLHYHCLTTILWLTLLTYFNWKKLYVISTNKDHYKKSSIMIVNYDKDNLSIIELKSKSIIQFYLLVYGIALIICFINIVVSSEQYITNKICFLNNFNSILILIIPLLIFIFLLLIFLFIARNYIKYLTNETIHLNNLSNKSNEILPIINSSSLYSNNINYQHKLINQLLSILSQLILLIFLFLSSLFIYLHPLHSFKLNFEHIIYSHLYGFFVLFLTFYILSFYVLSHIHLLKYDYFKRKKDKYLSNQLYIEPPLPSLSIDSIINNEYDIPSCTEQLSILPSSHSNYSSNKNICEISQNIERTKINNDFICDSKHLTNITSKYYICQHCIIKTNEINSSQNIPNNTLPFSSLDTISQKSIDTHQSQRNSFYKRSRNSLTESHAIQTGNTQLQSSSFTSSRSLTYPRRSPSQAIIRSLPSTRLSSQNSNKNLSNSTNIIQSNVHQNSSIEQNNISTNDRNSHHRISSPSYKQHHDTDVYINKIDHLTQQESSIWKKPSYKYSQVIYINDDDERSVSLKSTISDSKTLSCIVSTKKDHSQTISPSSSSSSSNFSNDFHNNIIHTNKIKLHESSV